MPVLSTGTDTVTAVIRNGDYLSLYAVAFAPPLEGGVLTATWSTQSAVAADSGYVRFVAGTPEATVVYVRDQGAPVNGIAELCYFDLGTVTDYYHRAAGNFDVISGQKSFGNDSTRTTIMAPAGHKYTYVLVGDTKATVQVIALPDP
jgi:hypothetical protein